MKNKGGKIMSNNDSVLAYSFHLSNDKNKTKRARKTARNNKSKTTSFNNSAIQNSKHLSKVNHHNLRKYDDNQELIYTIRGTNDIVKDVKALYKKEFEKAKEEYNKKQTRDDRKINNYFNKISDDDKHDLACEIIIELGDMKFWKNKSMHEKYKMNLVFEEQIQDLEKIVPEFKVANATVHYDESSPHIHVVGIAIKENCKTGMSKQVGKSTIFTRESLRIIQDKMRECCINSYNKIYGLNATLKKKKKGKNQDIPSSEMGHVKELEATYEKQKKQIEKINNKNQKLDNKSKEIKNVVDNLKPIPLNKNNSIISNEDKKLLLDYIEQVNQSSNNVKEITNFTLSMNNIREDFKNRDKKEEELQKIIDNQEKQIDNLSATITRRDNKLQDYKEKIIDLQKDNKNLRQENANLKSFLEFWQDKFDRLIRFFKRKLHNWLEKDDKYIDVVNELYEEEILDRGDIKKLEKKEEKDLGIGL